MTREMGGRWRRGATGPEQAALAAVAVEAAAAGDRDAAIHSLHDIGLKLNGSRHPCSLFLIQSALAFAASRGRARWLEEPIGIGFQGNCDP